MVFTVDDIFALRAKFEKGTLFSIDEERITENKSDQYKTYYVGINCKTLDDKLARLDLKIINQIIASNGKISSYKTEENADSISISFKKMKDDDYALSDYKQNQIKILKDNNEKLIKAFDIIDEEFRSFVTKHILKNAGGKYKVANKTVGSFKQSMVEAKNIKPEDIEKLKESKQIIEKNGKDYKYMDNPLYRTQIRGDKTTKKLGYFNKQKKFIYTVHDSRKFGKNPPVPTQAQVKEGNKFVDLSVTNAKNFITYLSTVSGNIYFDSAVLSKNSITIGVNATELYVNPHKKLQMNALADDDISGMSAFSTGGFDDNAVSDDPDNLGTDLDLSDETIVNNEPVANTDKDIKNKTNVDKVDKTKVEPKPKVSSKPKADTKPKVEIDEDSKEEPEEETEEEPEELTEEPEEVEEVEEPVEVIKPKASKSGKGKSKK